MPVPLVVHKKKPQRFERRGLIGLEQNLCSPEFVA